MRALLVSCLVIAGLALALPGVAARYLKGLAPADAAAVQVAARAESREVRIAAQADGHYYVDAFASARQIRFMVDTGATIVTLRQSDAKAAGLRIRDADRTLPVQTANGVTFAAQAELDSLDVGNIAMPRVAVLVLPDAQLGISLLGGSFLGRLRRMEVSGGTLILEK